MIVALALSPALDVTYEVDRLALGGITRPTRVTRVAGGKALNAVRTAVALGADALAIVPLGGPTGGQVLARLADDGVTVIPVPIASETRTCLAIVESAGGSSSTDLYEAATAITAAELATIAATALERVSSGDWVLISGSLPTDLDLAALASLLSALRERGARVAVDGSGAGLRATAAAADLLKINVDEAAELLEVAFDAALDAARALNTRFGIDAIVTDGVRAAGAVIDGRAVEIERPTAIGRFSAGSGDAFLGGVVAGLAAGAPVEVALRSGAAAAQRNAMVAGPGVLGPA